MIELKSSALVLSHAQSLVKFQVWPLNHKLNYTGWLENFDARDEELAKHLLSKFIYFSEDLVDQSLRAAFNSISNVLWSRSTDLKNHEKTWREFMNTCLVTFPTGENPSPADSGYSFARKCRDRLRIDESHLKEPRAVLQILDQGANLPIVFVDDFVGSGEQFTKTWDRLYTLDSGKRVSFRSIVGQRSSVDIYYVNVAAHSTGIERVTRDCPSVTMLSSNILTEEHSAVSAESRIWSPGHLEDGKNFIQRASAKISLTKEDGSQEDWRGFHALGLTVGFSHGIPDASLPIFFSERNNWTPLMTRSE